MEQRNILVLFGIILQFFGSQSQLVFHINKVQCIAPNETKLENVKCELKVTGRKQNVLTSMADVLEPLNSIHMNFQLLFKSQTNSYNVAVLNYTFEVCKSMNDFPPPMKFVLPVINMFAKNLIHPCPYVGREIGVKNFPLETAFQPVVSFVNLESGNYRLDVTFWNKNWEVLYWLKMYAEVGSKSIQRKHNRN